VQVSLPVGGMSGYAIAGTWLNEPIMAEVFDINTGSKVVQQIGDQGTCKDGMTRDHSEFHVAAGAGSGYAAAIQTCQCFKVSW